jgi:hypothetical protein
MWRFGVGGEKGEYYCIYTRSREADIASSILETL